MPTVLHIGPYRFFFYANENGEPRYIHVQKDRMLAKFWPKPVSIARSTGFLSHDLSKRLSLVELNQRTFVEAWDEFFQV